MMPLSRHLVTVTVVAAALSGCAASVKRGSADQAPLHIPAASSHHLSLQVTGASDKTQSKDWEAFSGEVRAGVREAAEQAGLTFETHAPRSAGRDGTLVVFNVMDYRYVTSGARLGLGILTGNAYIDTQVEFKDLKTGRSFGARRLNTSSSAWEGAFSAMTDKQTRALGSEIVRDIQGR